MIGVISTLFVIGCVELGIIIYLFWQAEDAKETRRRIKSLSEQVASISRGLLTLDQKIDDERLGHWKEIKDNTTISSHLDDFPVVDVVEAILKDMDVEPKAGDKVTLDNIDG